jgi:hypothetical protein
MLCEHCSSAHAYGLPCLTLSSNIPVRMVGVPILEFGARVAFGCQRKTVSGRLRMQTSTVAVPEWSYCGPKASIASLQVPRVAKVLRSYGIVGAVAEQVRVLRLQMRRMIWNTSVSLSTGWREARGVFVGSLLGPESATSTACRLGVLWGVLLPEYFIGSDLDKAGWCWIFVHGWGVKSWRAAPAGGRVLGSSCEVAIVKACEAGGTWIGPLGSPSFIPRWRTPEGSLYSLLIQLFL